MIELTGYDGYRILDKFSVMVSRITRIIEQMGDTSLLFLDMGNGRVQECRALESRKTIQKMVNEYLATKAPQEA